MLLNIVSTLLATKTICRRNIFLFPSTLESRFLKIEKKADGDSKRIDSVETKSDTQLQILLQIKTDLSAFRSENDRAHGQIFNRLEGLALGMGKGLEHRFGRFINVMFKLLGIKHDPIEYGRKFPVPDATVHRKGTTEIEVDIFCGDPLILVECTSYLGPGELGKVDVIIKKRDHIEAILKSGRPRTILVVGGIHESIVELAKEKLSVAGIFLIDFDEFSGTNIINK